MTAFIAGPRGPKGEPGEPGGGLTEEQVDAIVTAALADLPPSGLTSDQVHAAVTAALTRSTLEPVLYDVRQSWELQPGSDKRRAPGQPANLEYAFDLIDSQEVPSLRLVAYRITGAFTQDDKYTELDADLAAGADWQHTPGNGTGAVGQYVVYQQYSTTDFKTNGDDYTTAVEAFGWDPFAVHTLDALGPIAITDENAGGVIGDIAYVVSGYVYNSADAWALAHPEKDKGTLLPNTVTPVEVGDVFAFVSGQRGVIAVAGNITIIGDGSEDYPPPLGEALWNNHSPLDYWPYLERYNLNTKTWLSRIKLPKLADAAAATYHLLTNSHGVEYIQFPAYYIDGENIIPQLPQLSGRDCYLVNGGYNNLFPGDFPLDLERLDPQIWASSLEDGPAIWSSGGPDIGSIVVAPGAATNAQVEAWLQAVVALMPEGSALPEPNVPAHEDLYYAAEGGIAGVIGGKLYFGGGDGDSITGKEFFVFDPATEEFERLNDIEIGIPDYSVYGVVAGALWWVGNSGGNPNCFSYSVADDAWTGHAFAGDASVADQVQGVEVDGKLYFVYDRMYVFDPVALTVEAKAATPSPLSVPLAAWTDGTDILIVADNQSPRGNPRHLKYRVASDVWTTTDTVGAFVPSYSVTVTRQGVPYALSGLYVGLSPALAGVYGLTGSGYSDAPSSLLQQVQQVQSGVATAASDLMALTPRVTTAEQNITTLAARTTSLESTAPSTARSQMLLHVGAAPIVSIVVQLAGVVQDYGYPTDDLTLDSAAGTITCHSAGWYRIDFPNGYLTELTDMNVGTRMYMRARVADNVTNTNMMGPVPVRYVAAFAADVVGTTWLWVEPNEQIEFYIDTSADNVLANAHFNNFISITKM